MRRRLAAIALTLTMAGAACSGNQAVAGHQSANGAVVTPTTGGPGATPASPSGGTAATGPGLSASGGSAPAPGTRAAGAPLPAPPAPGTVEHTSGGQAFQVANLFPAAQDRIGFTSKQITLCLHAPLILGPAFSDSQTDWNVYWQWLNDRGGIDGRAVKMFYTDDEYTPQGGVQAAQQCQQDNPFFMTAGVGFDTVPAVRAWAEQNKMLYLASFATENGLYNLKYTFQVQPSVEQFGAIAGDYTGVKDPGRFGVIWRNSPNWQGGRDRFEASVRAHGSKVVADVPVQENQGDYSAAILQLQMSGAQTVLAWMNVLEFAQLEKQAAAQGYHPRWVTAAFNLVTQTVGSDIDGTKGASPAVGLWVTPEFHTGDTTDPWSPEERTMEAAFAHYDPKHTLTDTDWQAWLGFKGITQLLLDCGSDCSRNKLAGMFLGGYRAVLPPLCPIDFGRGRGRLGAFALNVMQVTDRNGTPGWKQVASCAETF